MKKELIGYVTGMVNNHNLTLEMVGKTLGHDLNLMQKKMIGNLDDLLEYIVDMPEEEITENIEDYSIYVRRIQELENETKGQLIKIEEVEKENKQVEENNRDLKSDIKQIASKVKESSYMELQELTWKLAETKESLGNMMDNEARLNKRVENAELSEKVWKGICDNFAKKNVGLREQVNKLNGQQWKED